MRKAIVLTVALMLASGIASAQDDQMWCLDQDAVRADVDGSTVTIIHEAALYNCCPDPFEYEVAWEDDQLVVTEVEVLTNPCYCLCCYELYATVENVPSGEWSLLFRWYDYETYDWLQVEVPFTVENIGQSGPLFAGDSDDSGCIVSSDVDDAPRDDDLSWGRVKALYE